MSAALAETTAESAAAATEAVVRNHLRSFLERRGVERFALRTLRVDGELAYITWDIGADIPLGTDTFLVRGGRILVQTCALLVAQPRKGK